LQNQMSDPIVQAVHKLERWISRSNWVGYDPFEGLSARGAQYLTLGNPLLRMALQQGVRRVPFNLRPLLGIRPKPSTKGMGYFASGYLKLYRAWGREEYLEKARYCLGWLGENYSPGYAGHCWGNHFDYQSRVFYLPAGVPTVVWTAFIGHAFLEAYELLGEESYLQVARSACEFILRDLSVREHDGAACISYIPGQHKEVHNANMLAASLLAWTAKHTGEAELFQPAEKAVGYTMKHQRADGSWYYGEDALLHWVDNFHTGFVLDALAIYVESSGDDRYMDNLRKGLDYYRHNLFQEHAPKYYNSALYPVDIQSAAQSIQTFARLKEHRADALSFARGVALWAVEQMQDPEGYFYFRKYRFFTNKTPLLHWGQATMLAALGWLICQESGVGPAPLAITNDKVKERLSCA
jgi:hypothetical protein